MIRALVVDDSAFNRVTLTRMLESSVNIDVVGVAVHGEDAIKQTLRLEPDVITLDLEMPVMDGFAFLRWVMANRPTPVIVVSSKASDRSVFKALELGAIDFIAKPGGAVSPRLYEIQQDLLSKVEDIHSVRLENAGRHFEPTGDREKFLPGPLCIDLVAIGCSTGGPPALQTIFESLPHMEVPIVVAQHMPPVFTGIFAERLDRLTSYVVREAVDGEKVESGVVYIAPGGMQTELEAEDGVLRLRMRERYSKELYAPSVDQLFASAARVLGSRMLSVILTGMGDDGARGMLEVRKAGGLTVAEAPTTAIIFGMPGAAIRVGAVQQIIPLDRIAAGIAGICTRT